MKEFPLVNSYSNFFYAFLKQEIETAIVESQSYEPEISHQRKQSVSISMPSSPMQSHVQNTSKVFFGGETNFNDEMPDPSSTAKTVSIEMPKATKFYSQPMPTGSTSGESKNTGNINYHPRLKKLKDKRFDSFKTWSGKLERQLSNLRGRTPQETETEDVGLRNPGIEALPVDRYFDALEGPELETLRVVCFSSPYFMHILLWSASNLILLVEVHNSIPVHFS